MDYKKIFKMKIFIKKIKKPLDKIKFIYIYVKVTLHFVNIK